MQLLRTRTSFNGRSWTVSSNNACNRNLPMYIFCSVLLLSLGTAVQGRPPSSPSSLTQSQIPEARSQKEIVLPVDDADASAEGEMGVGKQLQHRHVRAVKSTGAESLSMAEDEGNKAAAKSEADGEGEDSRGVDEEHEHEVFEDHEDSGSSSQPHKPPVSADAQFEWRQLHFPSSSSSMKWQNSQLVAGNLLARPGRADSNFIRFGRSYNSGYKYLPYSSETGGDVTNGGGGSGRESRSTSGFNYANSKKNNFIRLGRENGRQNNFIRLGRRSGGPLAQEEHKRLTLTSPFSSNYYAGRYPTTGIGFFPSSPVAFYLHKPVGIGSPSLPKSSMAWQHSWANGNGNSALNDRDSDDLGASALLERSPLNDGLSSYNH